MTNVAGRLAQLEQRVGGSEAVCCSMPGRDLCTGTYFERAAPDDPLPPPCPRCGRAVLTFTLDLGATRGEEDD